MNPSQASNVTRFRVGIFTVLGLVAIGVLTVYVNDRPFWYRPCQLVHINVEDATGLKTKSPIRSLGLEIGYLKSVELSETSVSLGICLTAPIEVLPSTRAYLRGQGFLGDKFVELKPVKYIGGGVRDGGSNGAQPTPLHTRIMNLMISPAMAEETTAQAQATPAARHDRGEGREIPVGGEGQDVQRIVNRVDELVNQMTSLTTNLKQAIDPAQLRDTMRQLNRTLEAASKTLSPQSGLNQTAQRTLAKLEDAIEQLRSQMTRINKGEGSLGMLLNDPSYAEEIRAALRNVNKLLGKAGDVRFQVDIGGEVVHGYDSARGWFRLGIWPRRDRYYLIGISVDPRGRRTELNTTTTVAGGPTTAVNTVQLEQTGLNFTAMFGKVFYDRVDLSIGALYGDGAVSASFYLGREERKNEIQLRNDVYARGAGQGTADRLNLIVRPWSGVYVQAGVDTFAKVDGTIPYTYGAGVAFDDEDIKLLFVLR